MRPLRIPSGGNKPLQGCPLHTFFPTLFARPTFSSLPPPSSLPTLAPPPSLPALPALPTPPTSTNPLSTQANPLVVDRLNEIAREILGRAGVIIWEDPPLLTLSAPRAAFRDTVHHDACGAGAEVVPSGTYPNGFRGADGTVRPGSLHGGARCSAVKLGLAEPQEVGLHPSDGSWTDRGGLSEAVTQTLFPLLGCACGDELWTSP